MWTVFRKKLHNEIQNFSISIDNAINMKYNDVVIIWARANEPVQESIINYIKNEP